MTVNTVVATAGTTANFSAPGLYPIWLTLINPVSGATLDATELASELLGFANELLELANELTELLATELLEGAKELLELAGTELALLAAELMVVGGGVELPPPPPPQATRIELRATRLKYLVVLEFGILLFCPWGFGTLGCCTWVFCIGASSVSTPAFAQLLLIADDY